MPAVYFSHGNNSTEVGNLAIENGIDQAQWGYRLNTVSFPTYGGEVVQILSVYIDDVTLSGTLATYSQAEAIYSYFAKYIQIATQGRTATPQPGTSAYNMQPVVFTYPERNWSFKLYPKSVPGFRLGTDVVTPTWQLTAFVIDDSVNLNPIKDALALLAATESPVTSQLGVLKNLNDQISPTSGNPETNPFQTYDQGAQQAAQAATKYADYFNSLIPAYSAGDFSALTGGLGSTPASSVTGGTSPGQVQVPSTTTPPTTSPGSTPTAPKGKGGGKGKITLPQTTPHNAHYQQIFQETWKIYHGLYTSGGCSLVQLWVTPQGLPTPAIVPASDLVGTQASKDAVASFGRAPYKCKI